MSPMGANQGFLDGHVKWKGEEEFPPLIPGQTNNAGLVGLNSQWLQWWW